MATRPRVRRSSVAWDDIFVGLVLTFIGAWVFMLLVGVIHHEWIAALPTLGWWPSLLIIVMIDSVTGCVMYGVRVKLID